MSEPAWYCRIRGKEIGPLTTQQVKALSASGELQPHEAIRRGEKGNWRPAGDYNKLFAPARRPVPAKAAPVTPPTRNGGCPLCKCDPPRAANAHVELVLAGPGEHQYVAVEVPVCETCKAVDERVGSALFGVVGLVGFACAALMIFACTGKDRGQTFGLPAVMLMFATAGLSVVLPRVRGALLPLLGVLSHSKLFDCQALSAFREQGFAPHFAYDKWCFELFMENLCRLKVHLKTIRLTSEGNIDDPATRGPSVRVTPDGKIEIGPP